MIFFNFLTGIHSKGEEPLIDMELQKKKEYKDEKHIGELFKRNQI